MKKFSLDHNEIRKFHAERTIMIARDKKHYKLTVEVGEHGYITALHYQRQLKDGKRFTAPRPCRVSYPCWAFASITPDLWQDILARC